MHKLLFSCAFFIVAILQSGFGQIQYIYPLPGSTFHQPRTTIILRSVHPLQESSLIGDHWISISGTKSGEHTWTARLSDDRITVVIKTDRSFAHDEEVHVTVDPQLRQEDGTPIPGLSFSFTTRKQPTEEQLQQYRRTNLEVFFDPDRYAGNIVVSHEKKSLPWDSIPDYTITQPGTPAPGYVFFNSKNQFFESNTNSCIVMMQSDGTPVWMRDLGTNGQDFKINHSGYITYFDYANRQWIVLDSNLKQIGTLQCVNGYELDTNPHDIAWYPDNHVFLIAYDNQTIDMSQIVPGGHPAANVKGFIIQELDAQGDLVFEWRSWDHINITDAVSTVILTNAVVDYCHGNSVERDTDGNLIVSFRHLSEIMKINRQTGAIMWRMGGENNQFTFINDNIPEHFSYQHDARRSSTGTLTLLNNGNYLNPQRSSFKEYALDEVNKTATLVWYYEHPDVNGQIVYGRASGNAQRLPNGNTLINWGNLPLLSSGLPNFTEVDPQGNIVWELSFYSPLWVSYRAFRFEWDPCARVTYHTMEAIVKFNNVTLTWAKATGARGYELQYRPQGTESWTSLNLVQAKIKFSTLAPSTTYEWRVKTICGNIPYKESGFTDIATFTTMARLSPESHNLQLNVMPNPCSQTLYWTLNQPLETHCRLTITDLLGRQVAHYEWQPSQTQRLDISQLTAGAYVLHAFTEDKKFSSPFIVE